MSSNLYVTLNTGQKMPKIGFGTALAYNDVIRKAVGEALKCGYRSIDTAFMYQNEQAIGDELQEWFSKGKVKREEVFVTTKLPPYGNRRGDVSHFLKMSLSRLKLDYLDLFLIHHPFGFQCSYDTNTFAVHSNGNKVVDFETNLEDLWRGMEEQVETGRVKAIGVSNFNTNQIERIMKIAKIPPAVNQVEANCYLQQCDLVEKCKELGITMEAYSPLGSPYTKEGKSFSPPLLENPMIVEIAKHHGKSCAQVVLKFLLQQGFIVIPKSVTPERIRANFDVFDFHLSTNERKSLMGLDRGKSARIYHFREVFSGCERHKEYPF